MQRGNADGETEMFGADEGAGRVSKTLRLDKQIVQIWMGKNGAVIQHFGVVITEKVDLTCAVKTCKC